MAQKKHTILSTGLSSVSRHSSLVLRMEFLDFAILGEKDKKENFGMSAKELSKKAWPLERAALH